MIRRSVTMEMSLRRRISLDVIMQTTLFSDYRRIKFTANFHLLRTETKSYQELLVILVLGARHSYCDRKLKVESIDSETVSSYSMNQDSK